MSAVFTGGSRKVTRLNADIRQRLDNMIEKRFSILVGDANGADKAIQKYLSEKNYRNVIVFCTGEECRNNIGAWPTRSVTPPHALRDFAFFTAKDAEMAREADFALMLWDGESAGTIVNAARMVSAQKPVVLYLFREKTFRTLRSREDLDTLLRDAPRDAALKVNRYILDHAREFHQTSIFGAA